MSSRSRIGKLHVGMTVLPTFTLMALFTLSLSAQPGIPVAIQPQVKAAATIHARRSLPSVDEGERTFEQHCSRCHNAPEGFSTHISGTILRHMRVRASLSRHEEQVLLHFFNP